MARPKRIDYPGAWHHVMNRGARREQIFHKDSHCILFLEVVAEAAQRRGVEVHAYALMPNHYHLLVRSLDGTLSRFMQDVGGHYSRRLNLVYAWDGPLFRGRYRSQLVEDEAYLKELLCYLHLNPVRANLVREPQEDCWTSHEAYIGVSDRPSWMSFEHMLSLFGGEVALHDAVMAHHRRTARWPEDMDLTTGWRLPRQPREAPVSIREPHPPLPANQADQVLAAVVQVTGVPEQGLRRAKQGRGGNPARRAAVLALARWTTHTQREIGAMLGISTAQVAVLLHRYRRSPGEPVKKWLESVEEVLSVSA